MLVLGLVAPYCAILRDYLSDTPLLRAMGFFLSQHGQLGAIPPPPFLSVSPLESMRSGGAIPPPQRGYLSDTGAIPYENKANGCDTPLCNTISKGYCAIWGNISHWAAKVLGGSVSSIYFCFSPLGVGNFKVKISRNIFRKAPDTFNFLRHVMRAILSVRPKCSHRCVSLKETLLKPVQILKHTTQYSTEQSAMRTKWFKHTLKTLTSLIKEVRPFFLSDNSIWSFASVSCLGVLPLFLALAITVFGGPEGYFSPAIIAFGAFQFIVPKYPYRLGKMEFKQSSLLI